MKFWSMLCRNWSITKSVIRESKPSVFHLVISQLCHEIAEKLIFQKLTYNL